MNLFWLFVLKVSGCGYRAINSLSSISQTIKQNKLEEIKSANPNRKRFLFVFSFLFFLFVFFF